MPRGARSTGMYQQKELAEKLRRLERTLAETRATVDEASRRIEQRQEESSSDDKSTSRDKGRS